MSQTAIAAGIDPVLPHAFRDPERFIERWHRGGTPYSAGVFLALAGVAVVGTFAYGAVIALCRSTEAEAILQIAGLTTLASAIAWVVPLPAIYILNSMTGLRLRASTTFLASLVSAAWGGLALLAFLPVALVYLLAFPGNRQLALMAHLIVFALTGFSMAVIFGRQVERLEPRRGNGRVWWLWLFVALQVQLLYSFGVITFEI
ncbi:MAG: hypothetical protein U0736_25785 [Gemmataceae bacterium]